MSAGAALAFRACMAGALLFVAALAACGGESTPTLSPEALMDPRRCQSCHPDHFTQWAGSMHAYAAQDPVFLAMNRRGQRETDGGLGTFCVGCHAPLAVRTGATKDGLNLAELPAYLRGVTCFFCHTADAVEGTHGNPLRLAGDGVMRGGISDPVPTSAHRAAYSPIHDRQRPESSAMCGSCHDIVNGLGTPIERTFAEWKATVYNHTSPQQLQTCGKCHMSGHTGLAAQATGAVPRTLHDHSFPAVDVALTTFPGKEEQLAGIARDLSTAVSAKLCVVPDRTRALGAEVTLDNVAVGHGFPSGASQDRRLWLELIAYNGETAIYRSGAVADDQPVLRGAADPDLWLLRDVMHDAAGNETHDFWNAKSYESEQLPPAVTNDPTDPRFFHAVTKRFPLPDGLAPERITVRLRLRPVGLEVLDDLIATGDLDPMVRAKMPVFDLPGTKLEWRAADRQTCVTP